MVTEKMIEAAARAIWAIRRVEEDRCDMSLEDMGGQESSVWHEAKAALEAALSAQVQDVADKGWLVEHNPASTLIYCLKQDGWRKGEPVLVNDITIRIENANKSYHALGQIAEAILIALPVAPAAKPEEKP